MSVQGGHGVLIRCRDGQETNRSAGVTVKTAANLRRSIRHELRSVPALCRREAPLSEVKAPRKAGEATPDPVVRDTVPELAGVRHTCRRVGPSAKLSPASLRALSSANGTPVTPKPMRVERQRAVLCAKVPARVRARQEGGWWALRSVFSGEVISHLLHGSGHNQTRLRTVPS